MRMLLITCLLAALPATPALAATFTVNPDGTGDFPAIQQGIDVCVDGDIIELVDGTYTGAGNRDIDFLGKAITLRSRSLDATRCVIDCQGSAAEPHRAFWFHQQEGPDTVVEYVTITGGDTADRLVKAQAPTEVAAMTEIHETTMNDEGTMMMGQVPAIEVPAGGTVLLEPGGYHIMLMKLAAPLESGQKFDVVLTFETAGDVTVPVEVREQE